MTIPAPALQSCLQLLEQHAAHPATPALHDPIYGLLQEPSDALEAALAAAIVAHAGHPATPALRAALEEHLNVQAADLPTVLARHGIVETGQDLVATVDRRLDAAAITKRMMGARIQGLETALVRAERSANGLAALGSFALLFALVGWAIALGVFEVQWMDAPVPEDLGAAVSGRGAPSALGPARSVRPVRQ